MTCVATLLVACLLALAGCGHAMVATTGIAAGLALVTQGAEATSAVVKTVEDLLDLRERVRAKPPAGPSSEREKG